MVVLEVRSDVWMYDMYVNVMSDSMGLEHKSGPESIRGKTTEYKRGGTVRSKMPMISYYYPCSSSFDFSFSVSVSVSVSVSSPSPPPSPPPSLAMQVVEE